MDKIDLNQIIEAECTFCGKIVKVPIRYSISHELYSNTVNDCDNCSIHKIDYNDARMKGNHELAEIIQKDARNCNKGD